jgi:hypothetical protein
MKVLWLCLTTAAAGSLTPVAAQQWVVPRTPQGHPDLQGNWTNATMTPVQRPPGIGAVLTPDQVAALESGRQDFIEEAAKASDPNRGAPPDGGILTGDPLFDGATGGTGGTGNVGGAAGGSSGSGGASGSGGSGGSVGGSAGSAAGTGAG